MNEIESTILGGLLLEPSQLMEIDITVDDFEFEVNREVFSEICRRSRASELIDIVAVAQSLQSRLGRNFLPILGEMCKVCVSPRNTPGYAKMLRERAQERKATEIAGKLTQTIKREGMAAVSEAIRALMSLNSVRKNYECSIVEAMRDAVDVIDEAFQRNGALIGVDTGIEKLNSALGGLHRSDLYVVGARPSVGKTAFLLNLASHADCPVGVISSEQAREQIGVRLIAINGKVSAYRMRTGKLGDEDWPRITAAVGTMSAKNMWLYDKPSPSLDEIYHQARKWKFNNNIGALYVDYIQRIKVDSSRKRHEAIGEVVRGLKELARELDIPVVALSQVNRDVEKRQDKRPGLADLSDSSEIEKEGDAVMSLYRDDVYDSESNEKGTAEVNILKNRHGPTGMIRILWHADFMRFSDFDSEKD